MNNDDSRADKIILAILAIIFWPISLIYLAIKSEVNGQSFSGNNAECAVSERLQKLDVNHYRVLNNICLPSSGSTEITQIDHIVVSNYGIFCIETKGQSGWIFGSKNQKYWTEVIYRNKYKLYNPIWQNYAHTKAIENLLDDKLKAPIVPFLIFPNSEKVKIDGRDLVGNGTEILDKIAGYSIPIYTNEEYTEISNKIYTANITDKDILKKHNQEVQIMNIEER